MLKKFESKSKKEIKAKSKRNQSSWLSSSLFLPKQIVWPCNWYRWDLDSKQCKPSERLPHTLQSELFINLINGISTSVYTCVLAKLQCPGLCEVFITFQEPHKPAGGSETCNSLSQQLAWNSNENVFFKFHQKSSFKWKRERGSSPVWITKWTKRAAV